MNDDRTSSPDVEPTPLGLRELEDLIAQADSEEAAVDLHSHSRHSDGDWTPPELIADAEKLGLRLISLTDHDTVAGQVAARFHAAERGLIYLTGMEVSLLVEGRLYHVLAYDFDPASPTWERFAEVRQARRERFTLPLFEQLAARGYAVSSDVARDENGRLVPNALGVALEKAGLAPSADAGRTMARNLGLSYPTEMTYLDVHDFAGLLRPGEAVFSVAHPARHQAGVSVRLSADDLKVLRSTIPLVALEAYHPYHPPTDVEHYRGLAAEHDLAVTTGSDAHGVRHARPLRRHQAALSRGFLETIRDRWRGRAGDLGENRGGSVLPEYPIDGQSSIS